MINRHYSIFLLFILSFSVTAQDISGLWEGTTKSGKTIASLKLDIKQDGVQLEGEGYQESLDRQTYTTFTFTGIFDNGELNVKTLKYTEKVGVWWCLPKLVMTYSETEDEQQFKGKWKPNAVPGGCLVGLSGKASLSKKITKVQPIVASSTPVTEFQMDEQGDYLLNALRERKYYALIIGVSNYVDESIVDLDQPVEDAYALKNVLIRNYTFEEENIIFLRNPGRTEIIEAFDKLSDEVTSTDQLLIFYAGHGIWDTKLEQGFWLPSNAKKSSKAQWISNGTIRDYIRAIDSKHTLLVADACFSGGILKERAVFMETRAMVELYKMPSRKAMTSGTMTTVPDKSVFIEYLTKNLVENELPVITADQLFQKFKIAVINNSPNGQVPQYGVIHQSDDEGGDFLFLKR